MPTKTSAKKSQKYTCAVGRRKTSIARVRLFEGEGEDVVNGKLVNELKLDKARNARLYRPLVVTENIGKYHFSAKARGGGKNGQLEAIAHGIARALVKSDKDLRKPLKKEGLLTRDPRMKERKKVGKLGARKSGQYSKR